MGGGEGGTGKGREIGVPASFSFAKFTPLRSGALVCVRVCQCVSVCLHCVCVLCACVCVWTQETSTI